MATTTVDDLDPALEPLEFDEAAMSHISSHMIGSGWLNETDYPLTLNQMMCADGHAMGEGINIGQPTIMKPANGQDTLAFFDECINGLNYQG